ncbi:MAG: hypothetical protein COB08_016630 [Rhodobacteraceae bacterium]|nr:hypothetical protein [Paracoccaceae bacterium]
MLEAHIFNIDFNEMVAADVVLFSQNDARADIQGNFVALFEGLNVSLTEDDCDENGEPDALVATGLVELNTFEGWGAHVKWCCRIDSTGIAHQSDLA